MKSANLTDMHVHSVLLKIKTPWQLVGRQGLLLV
ncbi:hypothetical protein SAMN05421731_102423 [Acinetobacter puyangensis]|uniref:Uncharacterized protein n=1 Tax=Acinetobacter puyangensis TaxID=1096779 RepID=A0A240E6N3_9GAMM|nr:hypothetical protein SAMN05421731_102423 [Acinetobacter puyangensis]